MGIYIGQQRLNYLWEKIKNFLATGLSGKADKATTLAGYGITDAINTSSTAQTKVGNLTAAKFIKSGGTSSQFLKADGSVDSNMYAPLASPALTGTPTVPTAANGTKTTQIANTAFVDNATTQSFNKIISMGENLVINGNGYMMDNTNFSSSVFNLLINNSSFGSFEYSGKNVVSSDYKIPLNPSLKYKLSADVKALNTGGNFYGFIDFYDIDGHRIEAQDHMWHSDQCSYLTQDLNPGDTVVHIADLSKWNNTYSGHSFSKGITFWNYTNSKGYTYPPYTYTRNVFPNIYEEDSDVDVANGIIHLKSAWGGPAIPANTKISRKDAGGTFKYLWTIIPTTDDWLTCYGFCSGVDYSGGNVGGKFPPGTAFGRVGFLVNYGSEEKTWITNISLTTCAQIVDIPAAVTESTVSGWGFTKNAGTITGITMNGASKGTSGVVNLGTVITSHQDISGKLDKTTFEWNKQLSNGSKGKVCLGKFFMYDSNVTIELSLTTIETFNATIVIASQNLNRTTSPGLIRANVYGDVNNSITPLLSIFRPNPATENGSVEVYADLVGWSKCLIHVQGVGLETKTEGGTQYVGAYDILSNVSAIPTEISGKTILTNDGTVGNNKVCNLLKTNYYSKVSNGTSSQFLKADGSVDGTSYGTYSKPSGGIPKTDLASAVQTSLGKADTALQSFTETDPTVPAWAKANTKPSYTAAEVGALQLGDYYAD